VFTISDPEPLSESDSDREWDGVSPQQFSDWLRPHWAAMAWLARRQCGAADWEDVLQEALSSAWRKRGQFDPERGTPAAWLLAITADQARRSRRRTRPLLGVLPGRVRPIDDELDLADAIADLSGRQRLAVDCFYFVGLGITETAAVMACSEGTVKSTLSDAGVGLRARQRALEHAREEGEAVGA
jgi:RNA polymerase sigma-70 factor (ECF subfamily)